jgi:hypothetical protein
MTKTPPKALTLRCHITHDGQIVWGDHLEAASLDEALAKSRILLRQRADLEPDGFEIWSGTELLLTEEYADPTSYSNHPIDITKSA